MIVIIDYGLGNLNSIRNIIKNIGYDSIISSEKQEIENASKLILPGVGSFDSGMRNLEKRNLINLLNQKVIIDKVPILGICLGMQLIGKSSEEGKRKGLNWIDGECNKFNFKNKNFKIPHMGWNSVEILNNNTIFKGFKREDISFYFVHSYYFICKNQENAISKTDYYSKFTSAIQKDNIFGVQFHPEKSHSYGKKLFENFIKFC